MMMPNVSLLTPTLINLCSSFFKPIFLVPLSSIIFVQMSSLISFIGEEHAMTNRIWGPSLHLTVKNGSTAARTENEQT